MPAITRYWRRLREEPAPLRFLASRLLWRSGLSHHFTIDCRGYRLRFYPTSLSAAYWTDPDARDYDRAFLESYLRPGDVAVDVGANIGALALIASSAVGPTGRVVAIEAHPRIFRFLQGNVALNQRGNVETLNYAVAAAPGTLSFSDRDSDDQNAVSPDGTVQVPASTLDSLLEHHPGPIRLLKVDVEGFEKFVFEGAPAVLARTACVYYECCERFYARYGYSSSDVVRCLDEAGFTVVRADGDGLAPVSAEELSEEGCNLIAARDLADLRERLRAASGGGPQAGAPAVQQ